MNDLKNISIRQFLTRRGILPKYERNGYGMYLSPLRDERTPSFKVDYVQNLWYDFGLGGGGRHAAHPRDAVGAVRQP